MFQLIFKYVYRTIKNEWKFVLLNCFCLVVGLTLSLLLYFWIATEYSYDKFHKNSNCIYRVINIKKSGEQIVKSLYVPGVVPYAMQAKVNTIENITAVTPCGDKYCKYNDKALNASSISVDTTFFKIFSFPIVEGSVKSFNTSPKSVAISKKFANKLFGKEVAVGKIIETDGLTGKSIYEIAMVIDVPKNSHIQFDIALSSLSNPLLNHTKHDWKGAFSVYCYIKLKNNITITKNDIYRLQNFLPINSSNPDLLNFQPINDIHLHTNFADNFSSNNSNILYFRIMIVGLVLIFLFTIVNYAALDISRSIHKTKVLCIKRLNGADCNALLLENFTDSMFLMLFSIGLSLLIAYLLMPLFNEIIGSFIAFNVTASTILFILGLLVSIPLFSGFLHVYFIKKEDLTEIIKGKIGISNISYFRQILSVIQLMIAISIIVFTLSAFKQIQFMQQANSKINTDNIISLPSTIYSSYQVDAIREELLKNPNILSVSLLSGKFNNVKVVLKDVWWIGKQEESVSCFSSISTDYYIKDILNFELTSGRFLSKDLNVEDYFMGRYNNGKHEYVINETAQKNMGLNDAIGTHIRIIKGHPEFDGRIVGVIKDFHFKSLKEKIEPLIICYQPEFLPNMIIKFNCKTPEVIKYIEKTIKSTSFYDTEFTYTTIKEVNDYMYLNEKNINKLFFILSIALFVLGILGFIGIVSYYINKEEKNITVQKVFGASLIELIKYYLSKRLQLYILPMIIALLITLIAVSKWLQHFAYHILPPYVLFISVFLFFLIVLGIIVSINIAIVMSKTSSQNLNK